MPEREIIDTVFILRRMQAEYHVNAKTLYMCFVGIEKAFDRVPRKVLEWALRKKGIPQDLVRSVMSLYEGAKTWVRVDSELTEQFKVKLGMHQGSVQSPFLLAVVIDAFTNFARKGALSELLCTGDLVLLSETIEGLLSPTIVLKLKEALQGRGLNVNLGKTKVMVCGSITKDGMSKSKADPCEVCSLRVKANSAL